jgi:hypothetical protein
MMFSVDFYTNIFEFIEIKKKVIFEKVYKFDKNLYFCGAKFWGF